MNKAPQNSAQMPDYLKARKLHLNGIIAGMAGVKKLNARAYTDTKVETLTIDAIKAELDFIDLQSREREGDEDAEAHAASASLDTTLKSKGSDPFGY